MTQWEAAVVTSAWLWVCCILLVAAAAGGAIYQTLRDVAVRRRKALPKPSTDCDRRWVVGMASSGFRQVRR